MIAPVVLFVYNRLPETQLLIESLLRNDLAKDTHLFIFSDGAKSSTQQQSVDDVRNYISKISGFQRIEIECAEANKGLAGSVIQGVSKIIHMYGRVIVLEDDLIIASDFLKYMNEALTAFEQRRDIWSIAGYTPDLPIQADYEHDLFLFGRASSHGWGTWANRWQKVDWEVSDFLRFRKDRKQRFAFNRTGNDMFRMLELQQMGRISSWAIRFCYTQFREKAYTVYPIRSKVLINGYGNGATHSGLNDDRHRVEIYEGKLNIEKDIEFDQARADLFANHQNLRLIGKIGYFLRKYRLGYEQIKHLIKQYQ